MIERPRPPWLSRLLQRTASPTARRPMRAAHLVPLIGFMVPTVAIGYGLVLPRNGMGGLNELTLGFAGALAGACVTYLIGVRAALRE